MKQNRLYIWSNVLTYLIQKNVKVQPLMKQFKEESNSLLLSCENWIPQKKKIEDRIWWTSTWLMDAGLEEYLLLFPNILKVPLKQVIKSPAKSEEELISFLKTQANFLGLHYMEEEKNGVYYCSLSGPEFIEDTDCTIIIDKAVNTVQNIALYQVSIIYDSTDSVKIYQGEHGMVVDYCEQLFHQYWDCFYKPIDINNSYALKWINLLIKKTQNHQIEWHGLTTEYQESRIYLTKYDFLNIDKTMYSEEYMTLSIENKNSPFCNKIYVPKDKADGSILSSLLLSVINSQSAPLPADTVRLKYVDTLIRTSSLVCKHENHAIVPKTGLINILTNGGEVSTQSVYVGYCTSCNIYFIFHDDYEKLAKKGTLLCRIYDYRTWTQLLSSKRGTFEYVEQSVLKAYGYNVSSQMNLSDLRRRTILQSIIENYIMDQNSVIEFLSWLIRTHSNRKNFQDAVCKWEKDREFIKKLNESRRDAVNISSVTVKR